MSALRSVRSRVLGGLTLLGPLLVLGAPETAPSSTPTVDRPSFIRFVAEGTTAGQVETAIKSYRNPDGVTVTLFAVVHIGDAGYYEELQRRFQKCDVLLYEMIRDAGPTQVPLEIDTAHPVSQLQIGMKRLLALEFQLDAIDYSPANFVHADLDPRTFARLQAERQESLLSLMIRVMLEEQARLNAGDGTTVSSLGLLMALMNPDRGYALKLVLGRQMDELERMLAGIESDGDGQGSVIVSARNAHAMSVLQDQLQLGHRHLGIFYGAAHMADFEERLLRLGYQATDQEWLTAWDIRPRAR
jgi:hypothetical protein